LAHQPLRVAALGLPRAHAAPPGFLVRAATVVARHRLPRPAVARNMIADPIKAGLSRGWIVVDAAALDRDLDLTADVLIVGSGAGGGVTAELLTAAGLRVIIVEEGPLA